MSKANSKKIMALVAIVALVAVLGVCLVACNAATERKHLEDKGYRVVTLTDNASGAGKVIYNIAKSISDFKEGVWATKGTEYVAVIWYDSLDGAKEAEASFKSKHAAPVIFRYETRVYAGSQ
ncbi:MAG: hypothetical protein K2N18_02845, partial [Clostridia bacterium]|nr:hypothetical protein [Clostridia bacterium]